MGLIEERVVVGGEGRLGCLSLLGPLPLLQDGHRLADHFGVVPNDLQHQLGRFPQGFQRQAFNLLVRIGLPKRCVGRQDSCQEGKKQAGQQDRPPRNRIGGHRGRRTTHTVLERHETQLADEQRASA